MADIQRAEELRKGVKPLSSRELKWVERLEKTLLACPTSRIGLAVWGDPTMQVFDNDIVGSERLEICDNGARENGVLLASVDSRPGIDAITN